MPVLKLTVICFLWLLGVALIWPILPFQALGLGATPLVVGLLFATDTAVAMVAAPLFGRLSDRLGRRPMIIAGLVIGAGGYVILAFATSLPELFLSRILGGLSLASIPALQAALADCTSRERRIDGFSSFHGAHAIAFVVGPLTTWQALEVFEVAPTAIALLAGATVLAAIFFLSPAEESSSASAADGEGEVATAEAGWRDFMAPAFIIPVAVVTLLGVSQSGWDAILAVWSEAKLSWDEGNVAIAYAVAGSCAAFSQFFIVPKIAARRGEVSVAILAGSACAVGLAILAVSQGGPMTFLALGLFGTAIATANSCLFARLTQVVADDRQGTALGLADSFLSMAWLVGPLLAGLAFESLTALPFLLGAALAALATGVLALWPQATPDQGAAVVQER